MCGRLPGASSDGMVTFTSASMCQSPHTAVCRMMVFFSGAATRSTSETGFKAGLWPAPAQPIHDFLQMPWIENARDRAEQAAVLVSQGRHHRNAVDGDLAGGVRGKDELLAGRRAKPQDAAVG